MALNFQNLLAQVTGLKSNLFEALKVLNTLINKQ
jgi:hypothetical protein